jgi:Tfp pilus assembly protein PilE
MLEAHRKQDGFALVALLVVIVVFGILAAVILAVDSTRGDVIHRSPGDAIKSACATGVRSIQESTEAVSRPRLG